MFRNVEDGNWLVVVDIDIEVHRHRQICTMFQEIINPQYFLSPPKDRFKLIFCLESFKGFNPYIHSISTAMPNDQNALRTLDVSFFACKCLPYICSGAIWQSGEVVGIHDKTSLASPSLLSSEVLAGPL